MSFFNRIVGAGVGAYLMLLHFKRLDLHDLFRGKRVAIVGPASSVYKIENGPWIDEFDVVIRINKAPYQLSDDKKKWLGSKTDLLLHSFFENDFSGGGPLNFELYRKLKIKYVVNPRNSPDGWRTVFNYYKKYRHPQVVYTVARSAFLRMQEPFGKFRPTTGFAALYFALTSPCKECFITGFTFFRTPYMTGYRDGLIAVEQNLKYIKDKGIHDPDLEYSQFKILLKQSTGAVKLDQELEAIVNSGQ